MIYILLAFLSGVAIETFYAFGVITISGRRKHLAALTSFLWGIAFLVGLNESFRSVYAAGAWCAGLYVGTMLGIDLEKWWSKRGS